MSATSLASEVANSALDTIAKALPKSLADRVQIGLVEQVFVWVVQNETDAKELVTILQDNGFKNIKLDGKGTTITAQSGGVVNATTDSDTAKCSCDTSPLQESCTGLLEDYCYGYEVNSNGCEQQCQWNTTSGECRPVGC